MRDFARRYWRLGCAAAFAFAVHAPAWPQAALTETQVKAGFVLNFARYVEWPAAAFASDAAPVVICVLGRDRLGEMLTTLESRSVQDRQLRVRPSVSAEELDGCHVVFIGETDHRRIALVLRKLASRAVLTIGDSERFIDVGGAIGIVPGEDRLQFEINRRALEQAGLKASANLLRLARTLI